MRKAMLAITLLVLLTTIAVPVFAAPKVVLETRTTWDSDMINVEQVFPTGNTGEGVYIAVLDTGLAPNWKEYFPADRIATKLAKGFVEIVSVNPKTGELVESGIVHEASWIGSTGSTHGTHVVSTIIGYNYYSPNDAVSGFPLPPLHIEGIAPNATIIPVKVLTDYTFPAFPKLGLPQVREVFGTDRAVAAGINYTTNLKIAGYSPMVISMSLGGDEPTEVIEEAIDRAIAEGVIVVAAAGNEGEAGMSWPGAYPQVISVGACGWTKEWLNTTELPRYRMWWLQDNTWGYNDIAEPTPVSEVYIANFSSRELAGQQLDVVAPGSWVRGPYPGTPGYAHLPWWSNGWGSFFGRNPGAFYYVGGTSMATPHVSAIAALMLSKDSSLTQSQVESILKSNALPIPADSMLIYDFDHWATISWGSDATGAGLVDAEAAVEAIT